MKNIIFIIVLLFLSSCKVQEPQRIINGTYRYIYGSSNLKEELFLKEDSSFSFNSYGTECDGKWKYIAKDTILISCRNPSIVETITQGYMNQRERKIKILNNDRIKVPITNDTRHKYLVLKRVY